MVSTARQALYAALLVLAGGCLFAAFEARRQASWNQHEQEARFGILAEQIARQVERRLATYEYGLRGARGAVLAGGEQISWAQFHRYAQSRDIEREFPGARGFGFIRRIEKADEAQLVEKNRADGRPGFAISQFAEHQGERFVIEFIEPEAQNRQAIGLDIASESSRRLAALAAVRSGAATLTRPITLVQDALHVRRGFLLLIPIYHSGAQPETPELRWQETRGWAYTPLLIDDVLADFDFGGGDFALSLYDADYATTPDRFYASRGADAPVVNGLLKHIDLSLYGRDWLVEVKARPSFVAGLRLPAPGMVGSSIAFVSLLLSCLVYVYLLNRGRRRQSQLSQARLAAIVENSADAIVGTALDGRVLTWNAAAERTFGYSPEEAMGRRLADLLVPPGLQDEDASILARVGRGESIERFTTRRLCRDGTSVEISMTVSPIRGEDGNIVGAAKIMRDISSLLALQSELGSALARLQLAADAAEIGVWVWCFADDRLHWDARMYALYGIDADDARPLDYARWHAFVHSDDIAAVERNVQGLRAGTGPFDVVFRIVREDGSLRYIQAAAIIERDQEGRPAQMVGINRDVTEQMLAERHILELNAGLESQVAQRTRELAHMANLLGNVLAAASEVSIIATDTDGLITLFNSGAEKLLGYQAGQMIGQRTLLSIHCPEEIRQRRLSLLAECAADVDGFRVLSYKPELDGAEAREWTYVRQDGHRVPVSVVITPMHDQESRLVGYLGIAQDVTEQHAAERELRQARDQAEAANRAKSDFLANMSHEIRTPMNAILGLVYLLAQQPLTADVRSMLEKIDGAGRSLLGIINDILDFSKIEAQRLEIECAPFHLSSILNNLAGIMSAAVGSKPVEVLVGASPEGADNLKGDALRLGQVLINLAGNAIKFTEKGEVVVKVEMRAHDPLRKCVRLRFSVRDTGIGIPPEKQEIVFSAFSQADSSITRSFGGTGLGLSISRRLVSLMGGTLELQSEVGRGSEFSFELELALVDTDRTIIPELQAQRVLVADDHELARMVLAEAVGSLGWQVEAVDSGVGAIAEVEQAGVEAYDLLLLDWRMPDVDGLRAAKAIRQHAASAQTTPIVIMVTASDRESLRHEPDCDVVDAVLSKPVTSSSLYDTVLAIKNRRGELRHEIPFTSEAGRLRGLRLLVVDDSDINREVALQILEREGAVVELAEDGQGALRCLAARPGAYDAVLMDVQMPVMDGYAATAHLRANPATAALPVVALTAGAFKNHRDAAIGSGMNAFVAKPFDVDELVAVIRKVVGWGSIPLAQPKQQKELVLDLERALSNWGSRPMLLKQLALFASLHGQDPQRFREQFAAGQRAACKALLHKLKGAAGAVSLGQLVRCVARIEAQLDEVGDEGGGELAHQFEQAMAESLEAIRAEQPADAEHQTEVAALPVEAAALDHLEKRLLEALDQDDPACIETLITDTACLLPAAWVQSLQTYVDRFDFRGAETWVKASLADIRKQMSRGADEH